MKKYNQYPLSLAKGIKTSDYGHVLVFGQGRTGKTERLIMPNVATLRSSVVVIGKESDRVLEKTETIRRKRFKQPIFHDIASWSPLTLISPSTTYILSSPYCHENKRDKILEAETALTAIMETVYANPITVFIDGVDELPIDKDLLLKALTLGKDKNLRLVLTAHDFMGLKSKYGPDATNAIVSGCDYKVFMGSFDPETYSAIELWSGGNIKHPEYINTDSSKCIVFAHNNYIVTDKSRAIKGE